MGTEKPSQEQRHSKRGSLGRTKDPVSESCRIQLTDKQQMARKRERQE